MEKRDSSGDLCLLPAAWDAAIGSEQKSRATKKESPPSSNESHFLFRSSAILPPILPPLIEGLLPAHLHASAEQLSITPHYWR